MKYIFHEPAEYTFRDIYGHHGKVFGTESPTTEHLIIECENELTVSLKQRTCEYNYYILEGEGHFILNDAEQPVVRGDLVVVPPGTKYRFGGKLKMLLINTPHWSQEQEEVIDESH